MNIAKRITNPLHRAPRPTHHAVAWLVTRAKTRVLKAYADWRVGATRAEKHAYQASDSILLTFDDYGSAQQIDHILRILRRHRTRGLFFLQGDWAQTHPRLVQRIARAGHLIGNHTYSHPNLLSLPDDAVRAQITQGVASQWLRPPQGRYNARIRRLAAELGYRICYWTIDSDDWQGVSADYIVRKISAELHPGAVILFHLHGAHTIEALPAVIDQIHRRGYQLAPAATPAAATTPRPEAAQ
jgi:peptidoglycan/xylan/chitin deacetylase (PgdA/CDA1 family)